MAHFEEIRHTSPTRIEEYEVDLPSIDYQEKAAHILDTIQAKIQINNQINENLEAMAKSIFEEWFIDFGPVKAKAEGKKPFGMDAETAILFPDSFEESELGMIPKGWGVESLDVVATFLNGLALQKFPPIGLNDLPVIKIAQLRINKTNGLDMASNLVPKEYIIEDGDVLFSWSGSLEVRIWTGGKGVLNQHLFKVDSKKFPKWFYYLWCRYHLKEFREIAEGKATTMGHIQRKHLTEAKVLIPDSRLMPLLSKTMEPLINKMIASSIESKNLEQLRDTLLPRLISGELEF